MSPLIAGVTAKSAGISTSVTNPTCIEGVPLAASVLVAVTRTKYCVPGVRPVIVCFLLASEPQFAPQSITARRSVSLNS